jgi:hypothetical protein
MTLSSMTSDEQRAYFVRELRQLREEIASCYREGLTSAADALTEDEIFLCQCLFDLDN